MQMRLLLSAALLSLASAPLRAQNEPGRDFQFADPDKFFQQLFGRQIEQDQAALAGVDVTAAEEQQYGDRAAQAFIQKLRSRNIPISWKGQDVAYVKQLVQVIHPQMQNHDRYRTFKVFVVESDETDAFAFPVGTLFVFRGMLEFAQNEAALVGVIGHELSHIDHGHQLADLWWIKLAQQTYSSRGGCSPDKFF